VGSRRGRSEGAELKEENKRGGGVQRWRGLNLSVLSKIFILIFNIYIPFVKSPPPVEHNMNRESIYNTIGLLIYKKRREKTRNGTDMRAAMKSL
jgi:hypothetical protein